jgi:DNA-binding NtrC family response regulator
MASDWDVVGADRTHHDTNRRRNMSQKILLLGITDSVLANAQQQLTRPDLEVFLGKNVEDVRSRLSQTPIDHVFIGGRLAEETHLEVAWEVIQASETTTVHLQDRSGPEGFLPFVQAVLRGLVPDEG